jgi:hypothetical protein
MSRRLGATLLFAVGCFPSIDEAVAEHRAAVTPSLERVARAAAAVPSLPLLENDRVKAGPRPLVIALDDSPSSKDNAAVVYVEDLERLGELGAVYGRITGAIHVAECAAFLEHRTHPWDPRKPERWTESLAGFEVETAFELCSRLDYLLVVRTLELAAPAPPVAATEAACASARCEFKPARARVEVHVLWLEPFEHLGGFRVEATNGEKIEWTSDVAGTLELNLTFALTTALGQGIRTHVPAANVSGLD